MFVCPHSVIDDRGVLSIQPSCRYVAGPNAASSGPGTLQDERIPGSEPTRRSIFCRRAIPTCKVRFRDAAQSLKPVLNVLQCGHLKRYVTG